MRPQFGVKFEKVSRKNQDILIALDTSKSMLAQDIKPSRFFHAKQEIRTLLERLKGDQVGLIGFAGEAYVECPLTLDYLSLAMSLSEIEVGSIPIPGTDIATAIKLARQTFNAMGSQSRKILIVMTDGESFENDPIASAEVAQSQGVTIYTIGIGSATGEPIPEYDDQNQITGYKKDKEGNIIVSKLDEEVLTQIASIGNGAYFRVDGSRWVVEALYDAIANVERVALSQKVAHEYKEQYQWPLAMAFFWILLASLIPERQPKKFKWEARISET